MAAKASSSKSSTFFKKSSSSSSSSSFDRNSFRRFDRLLKILRRLRPILVKDLVVCEILERLSSDDVIGCRLPRSDVDDHLSSSSSSSSSWRVDWLLDRLERTDEALAFAFVDAVRDRRKHIACLIDNMINNYNSDDDDDDDGCGRVERSALAGEALRRILRKSTAVTRRRCVQENERIEEEHRMENIRENSGDESEDYLSCFVVSTRGKGQTERWMKHEDIPRTKEEKEEEGKTYMAVVTKDLVFRSIDPSLLPVVHLRRPPTTCREVFVVDREGRYSHAGESRESGRRSHVVHGRSFKGHDLRSKSSLRTESFLNRQRDISQMTSLPPPLPPKPDYLPHLSFLSAEEAGRQCCSISPTDPRDAPSSIQGGPTILAPSHAPPLPRRSDVHRVSDYWTETSNSEELKARVNVELEETNRRDWSKELEDDDGDQLSLNFAVEVEDTETVDDDEDAYEAVNHKEEDSGDDVVQLSGTSPQTVRKEETETDQLESKSVSETLSSDLSAKESHIPSSISSSSSISPKPPELQTRIKSDATEESNTDFPGKLSARDSGVDSVASQGFPDSTFGPESVNEHPEVFLPCSAIGHSKTTKEEEQEEEEEVHSRTSSSSNYSYYEDIETFSAQPRLINRSMATGSTSDRKMIPTGSLFLADTDDACVTSGVDDDQLAVYRGTVLGYDREGVAFYCPRDALRRFGDPDDEPWFYPISLNPHEATVFLHRENQKGCFVVYRPRTNSSPPPVRFLLSVCGGGGGGGRLAGGGGGGGDVVHYSIVENVRGDFKVEGHDHSFMTLGELVTYFRRNQSHLVTRLRRPLKDARTPIQPGIQYPERMEIAKNEIQLDDAAITGGHVMLLCQGRWNGSSVTVKVMPKDSSAEGEDDFVEEAMTLISLRHDNVVRLLGLSCRVRPFYIVTESMEQGSLAECLRNSVIRPESIEDLFDVCLQVAGAMSYLESRRFVLHRALAARNFFVTKDHLVKLMNFDRARVVLDDHYLACDTEEVQVRWAAPEVLRASSYSTKSDVWAAGVVFWEVHSAGASPYAKLTDEETAVYVANGGRLERPEHCSRDLFVLMKSCWRPLTSDRPSFAAIEEKFKGDSSVYYSSGQKRLAPPPLALPLPPPSLSVPSSPGISRVPRLPMKVKVAANPAKPSSPLTVATKKRHLSTLRESRSAEGSLQTTVTGGGGGGGGGLKVPSPVMCSSGGERVPTSSSDSSSVVSASVSNEFENKEDLSRGDKIRKSIRKLIIGKKTAK